MLAQPTHAQPSPDTHRREGVRRQQDGPAKTTKNRSLSRSARFEVGAITLKLCRLILETHGSSFKLGALMVA
jgi:hypothetical protein